MTTLTSVVKQQPLVAFFVFAYGLSWGNYFLSATYNARESTLLVILFHTAQNTIGGFLSVPSVFGTGPGEAVVVVGHSVCRGGSRGGSWGRGEPRR